MLLGISTYTFGWAVGVPGHLPKRPLTALNLLKKAKVFELKLVQYGDNLPLHTLPAEQLEQFIQTAEKSRIELEVGARGLDEAHLECYITIARKLKSRLLRFVIDRPDYQPKLNDIIALLKNYISLLEEHNITLGIENHDRLKAREFAQIMDAVGSNQVGICLDSVNSMGAGEGLEQIVETLAPYTVNLHLKDFGIERLPHLMGFQIDGRPAGKGLLNVAWLLKKLMPFARCQTAILEQWVIPEKEITATIQKEEIWAQESIDYLKPYFRC